MVACFWHHQVSHSSFDTQIYSNTTITRPRSDISIFSAFFIWDEFWNNTLFVPILVFLFISRFFFPAPSRRAWTDSPIFMLDSYVRYPRKPIAHNIYVILFLFHAALVQFRATPCSASMPCILCCDRRIHSGHACWHVAELIAYSPRCIYDDTGTILLYSCRSV